MPSDAVVCHRIDRPTRVLRWVRRLGMVVLLTAGGLTIGGVAQAFWTAGGVGIGLAATGTLTAPTNVVASTSAGSDTVSVAWNAGVLDPGGAIDGYRVARIPAEGGAPSAACGTSPTVITSSLACDDLGVPDGSYRYLVTAVHGSWTAQSAAGEAVTVLRNIDAPSVVATTSPAPNSNGFNNTTPVTVQLSATDADGISRITYQVNGGALMTVIAATASIPLSGDGTYTVTYNAVDTLGKTSPTGTRVVRIDTVAPAAPAAPTLVAASDTGTSGSDRNTNDRTPTFTGTVEPGATVLLFNDGAQVGSAVASIGGTYVVTAGTLLAEGIRSITVRAVDQADNIGALSAATSVTIDVTAPSVSPATPSLVATSDTGRFDSDKITADNTPDIFGSARNSGAEFLRLYVGSVDLGIAPATPTATLTASLLADGIHSITMRGSDAAGNLSPASNTLSITIDTVAPQAPSAPALAQSSDTGASSTDRLTNDSTPTVTGSNETSALVTLHAGASQVGTQVTGSTSYSITSSTLSDGAHTLTATATDIAGNTGPASAGTTVTIDTTAPTAPSAPALTAASDSGSSASDRVTNDNTPTFTGTATVGSNVRLYAATSATGSMVTASDGSWTATAGTLSDATYSITARTDPDLAGNVGISPSTSITVDTAAPNMPAAPTLVTESDTGSSQTDRITNDSTPMFSGSGSAGTIGVRLYDGGVEVAGASATPSYLVTAPQRSDGARSFSVRIFDLAGNLSVSSSNQTVTIDTLAPAAPSAPVVEAASDSGASSSDGVTRDNTPTVIGSNEASARVTVYAGASQVGSVTTSSASYSVTTSTLADGSHTLTATATDTAGNLGPASSGTTITIDTTAPTAPSAPVLAADSDRGVSSSDAITNDDTPTFSGTAAAGSNVRLFSNGSASGNVVVAADGTYIATTGTLASGSRIITARTDPDLAGNVGISPSTEVTIDTNAPTVQISEDSSAPPRFKLAFTEQVYGLTSSDVTLSGTASPTGSTITGGPLDYLVHASGMDRSGTVVGNLAAGAVTDTAGNTNGAPTVIDNVIDYEDQTAPTVAVARFASAGGQKVLAEGTVSTTPGDPSTVTVVLCRTTAGDCATADTWATLAAPVDAATGTWSVTSEDLPATSTLYARARATDLSGNTAISNNKGPLSIP